MEVVLAGSSQWWWQFDVTGRVQRPVLFDRFSGKINSHAHIVLLSDTEKGTYVIPIRAGPARGRSNGSPAQATTTRPSSVHHGGARVKWEQIRRKCNTVKSLGGENKQCCWVGVRNVDTSRRG